MATKPIIGANVDPEVKEEFERISIEKSEAGDKVPVADLVREALHEYLNKEVEGVA